MQEPTATARTRSILCASLLAAGRPLTARELSRVLELSPEGVRDAINDLQLVLREEALGLVVEEIAGGFRLVVDADVIPTLADLLSPSPLPRLSNAALETLALIAYHQPVTRGELEAARGASCSSTLETLRERELIRILGQKEVIGRPLLYGTTQRFLLEFGLKSLADLPPLQQPAEFLRD